MEDCQWERCQRYFWHQFSTSGQTYVWSSNSETAFQSLKVELTSSLTFANFHFGKTIHKHRVLLRMFSQSPRLVTVHWTLNSMWLEQKVKEPERVRITSQIYLLHTPHWQGVSFLVRLMTSWFMCSVMLSMQDTTMSTQSWSQSRGSGLSSTSSKNSISGHNS